MKYKLAALCMILCLLLSAVPANAAIEPFTVGYSLGPSVYAVDLLKPTIIEGAGQTGGNMKLVAGGSVTYGFYLPFNSRSVTIKYAEANGDVTINSGAKQYTLSLSGEGEYTLNFAEACGYEIQKYYYTQFPGYAPREYVERSGEREFTIASTDGITITAIEFEKEKTPIFNNGFYHTMPDVPETVLKTVSTVFLDVNAPILQVNGGRRYVDNNRTDLTPYNYNGTLYLPINTLAKALGYYCENLPDRGYAMLRNNTDEFVLLGDTVTLKKENGSPKQVQGEPILYRNGEAWAAVRYFAELAGETVGYKEGIIVIDDKYTVNEVLNDSALWQYASSIFAPFKETNKNGKTYYVAQTESASDDNNGSILAPFKTLAKAASTAREGDTVIIREGTYRETLAPLYDGKAGNPITFRAAEGEKVVISAADELKNFVKYEDNIYVTPMSWDLGAGRNQIFINGESMIEARYPNEPQWRSEGMSNLWPVRADLYSPVGDNTVIRSDTLLNQEENYWKGGYYVGLFGYGYALATAKIASSKPGEFKVTDTSRYWWWDHRAQDTWNYGSIIGHINALDVPGEWVKQEDVLYMIFPENCDPTTTQVEAKRRQLVIDVADRKYVNIEGIETIGGGVRMNNSEMCMLNHMDMKYISHYTLSEDQRDGFIDKPYDYKDTNGAPPRGEVGIFVGGTDNIIVNSHIDHSAAAGIYGVGLYTYIENNTLNDCGYMGSYVSGITFDTLGYESINKPRGGYAVYNNTVYNCGRACLNISMQQKANHYMAPYLPMEIAYNDFHDGILASLDTGLLYEYCINMGLDKQKTLIHHNYVYTTAKKEEENPLSYGIYHDNATYGTYTYDNVIFNTEEDVVFSGGALYVQAMKESPAYHDVWNNTSRFEVAGGPDGLTASDFPGGNCFIAGAQKPGETYLVNYESNVSDKPSGKTHTAAEATLSEGVILNENRAVFTENGQYICFKDVDFGEGADSIMLSVYGDKYYSEDIVDIIIGDDLQTGAKKRVSIQNNAPELNLPDVKEITVGYTKGVKDVYVRVVDLRSISISGLMVQKLTNAGREDSIFAAKIYGGEYTSYDISNRGMQNADEPTKVYSVVGDSTNAYVKDTWPGTVFKYEEQSIRTDSDRLAVAAGSGQPWSGQPIEFYLDSLDSEPIAKYYVNKNAWDDYNPEYVELNRIVPTGRYDIYVKFPIENDEINKSSNFYYFGFIGEGEELPHASYSALAYGGEFSGYDNSESVMKQYVPQSKPVAGSAHNMVNNTWPGTVIRYDNCVFSTDSEVFALAAGSGDGCENQPIELYVDSLSAEPVAKIYVNKTLWGDSTPQYTRLDAPVSQGTHTIFLKFPLENGQKNKTSNIYYFAFLEKGSEVKDSMVSNTVYAGSYSTEKSVQNTDMPFVARYVERPYCKQLGLTNTKSGTIAAYQNVVLNGTADKLNIRYATAEGYDGQTVSVRIGSPTAAPIAQFITNGTGWESFKTEVVKLNTPLTTGTYDVYLAFDGEAGSAQTSKIHWFGFN